MNEDKHPLKFRKAERLRHRSIIESVFDGGDTIYAYPLRITWIAISPEQLEQKFRNEPPNDIDALQVMITIPKRKLKHAVDRVAMRRRVREAYRLARLPLKKLVIENDNIRSLAISFIFIADKKTSYKKINKAVETLLEKLAEKVCEIK